MSEFERWLPTLQPPAGGLQKLRQRLAATERAQRPGYPAGPWWACAATLAVVIVVAAWTLPATSVTEQRVAAALSQFEARKGDDVRIEQGAALEVGMPDAEVRVFLVMGQ